MGLEDKDVLLRRKKAKKFCLSDILPERQIIIRTGAHGRNFTLTTKRQISVLAVIGVLVSWNVLATTGFMQGSVQLFAKDREIASLKDTYRAAFIKLEEAQSLFADITNEIENSQTNLLALAQRNNLMKTGKVESKVAGLRPGRHVKAADIATQQAPGAPLPTGDVTRIGEDRQLLERKVDEIQDTLNRLRTSNADFVKESVHLAGTRLKEVEKTLARVGVDPDRLIKGNRGATKPFSPYGMGGPFVPLIGEMAEDLPAEMAALHSTITRWDELKAAMSRLPLAIPLESAEITSAFGRRSDPINGLTGTHEGVDFGAPMGSPVRATAIGKVTYAGRRSRYGLTVDIDHGSGISTRYAHMSRVTVKLGQKVDRNTIIGALGNTGRSTGPHLHYEVRVDDQARDPLKFIAAGHNVFKRN